MGIKDVLVQIKIIAKENQLSEPYIVGGLPRDKVLGLSRNVEDVDLTTGDDSINRLAELTASHFKAFPVKFPDGHYQLHINGIKYDFSSNFNSPDAPYFLDKAGIPNPSQMQIELFSRDFTCNTLIIPLTLKTILDPTGQGIEDIKNRIIKTPLPPRITLKDDTKRVVRAIYLAAKLNFEVENDIISWVINNHDKIAEEVSDGFSKRKLASATRADADKTVDLMNKMKLWNVVGIPRVLLDYISGGGTAVPIM